MNDHGGRAAVAGTYNGDGGAGTRLCEYIVQTLTGNKGIAGSRIAFAATRTGRKEIYLADCDGTGIQQLTHDNSISGGAEPLAGWEQAGVHGIQGGGCGYLPGEPWFGVRDRIIKYPGTNSGWCFREWGPDRLHAEQGWKSGAVCVRAGR